MRLLAGREYSDATQLTRLINLRIPTYALILTFVNGPDLVSPAVFSDMMKSADGTKFLGTWIIRKYRKWDRSEYEKSSDVDIPLERPERERRSIDDSGSNEESQTSADR